MKPTDNNTSHFRQILSEAQLDLRRRIETCRILNAKEADEAAAEIAGISGYPMNSKEGEELLAALYESAGKLFPGGWEDYPLPQRIKRQT